MLSYEFYLGIDIDVLRCLFTIRPNLFRTRKGSCLLQSQNLFQHDRTSLGYFPSFFARIYSGNAAHIESATPRSIAPAAPVPFFRPHGCCVPYIPNFLPPFSHSRPLCLCLPPQPFACSSCGLPVPRSRYLIEISSTEALR